MKLCTCRILKDQRGAAAVEFAIVAAVFFMILIGVMEMGRMLWAWNAATEATRLGARLAVVCTKDDPIIETRMHERLPGFMTATISVEYLGSSVRVSLSNYTHQTIIPFIPLTVPLPPFQTTLPFEGMDSAGNPVCN